MLLIAMQDLLGFAPLADIARGLSILADVVIQGAMEYIYQQLVLRFGRPLCNTDDGQIMCEFVVLALGKLGASELNYSSDIDLMYLYSGSGKTTGPVTTTNQDFFPATLNSTHKSDVNDDPGGVSAIVLTCVFGQMDLPGNW